MTKIKNTKKGMAKKTLSMSLVVAMLATSNVPVWAAEFSDGTDAAVTSEAEAPVVTDAATAEFSDDTAEAPVVEDTEAVDAQATIETSEKYFFDGVKLEDDATNFSWKGDKEASDLFKADSYILDTKGNNIYEADNVDLQYAVSFGGEWTTSQKLTFKSNYDADLNNANITISESDLKANAGKTLDILLIEKDSKGEYSKVVKTFSFGTIQKVSLSDVFSIEAYTDTDITYNGTELKVKPGLKVNNAYNSVSEVSGLTADDFDWNYSTTGDYVNAGSKITVVGTLKKDKAVDGYETTLTAPAYTIKKRTLAANDVVVKVTTPGKDFTYGTNEIDKSEVKVFLKDFSKTNAGKNVASAISLDEYVKKVTLESVAAGKTSSVNVEFDSALLKASKNFTETAPTGVNSSTNAETTAEDKDKTVDVVALSLKDCAITIKNPVAKQGDKETTSDAIARMEAAIAKNIVIKKGDKELDLGSANIKVTLANGEYKQAKTYSGVVTVAGDGKNVKGDVTLDLVVVDQAFGDGCNFEGNQKWNLLTKNPADVLKSPRTGLPYNNGKEVTIDAKDLGKFSPDGTNYTSSQKDFKITYSNNVNATTDDRTAASVAKLTVTAVAGDYAGCSQDFYFAINPSTVNPINDKDKTTVTTAVEKDATGIAINDANDNNAAGYADAIGLKVNGTSDTTKATTDKDVIISNATANDYTVKYSYVAENGISSGSADDTVGSNKVGNYIKAEITLKKNGNFSIAAADNNAKALGDSTSVSYKTVASSKDDNGKVLLYVKIADKSIDTLDISLKNSTFTFTGAVIKPEVVVKNGSKTLKADQYTVDVEDGINAGTAKITVKVNGYTGSKKLEATINPADINNVKFELKKDYAKTVIYNGESWKPTIAREADAANKITAITEDEAKADVKLTDTVISKMFDITYGKNVDAGKEAGTVTLTPKALYAKNFKGSSVTVHFEIKKAVLYGTKANTLKLKDTTGKVVRNEVHEKLVMADQKLAWTGKEVTFASAEVVDGSITGTKKEDGSETSKAPTTSEAAPATSAAPTTSEAPAATSEAPAPTTQSVKSLSDTPIVSEVPTTIAASATVVDATEDDYEIKYVNNVDKTTDDAKAYVCVVAKGNFAGEYSLVRWGRTVHLVETEAAEEYIKKYPTLDIEILLSNVIEDSAVAFDITGKTFGAKDVTVSNPSYAGGLVVKPIVTVKDPTTGATLVEGTDYELEFDTDKVDATTKPIFVEVVGKGQYKGSTINKTVDGKELTYVIEKKDLKDCYVNVDKKDGKLDLTVMNGSVVEKKENFDVKDNGDGTATVSVVDGGKNYTGSVSVKISDADAKVGTPLLTNVVVKGNTATPVLSGDVDGAVGYDYVIATEEDYKNGRVDISKNVLKTNTNFYYVQEGTYYAYCHAWKRDENGKKVFGEWSNIKKFEVTATTPSKPSIKSVKVKGHTVTVTFTASKNAKGYDVVLGEAVKKVNGENRPVEYGKLVVKNIEDGVYTATFYNVPDGKYYAGVHSYNKSSNDGKKVFSKWGYRKKAISVGKAK